MRFLANENIPMASIQLLQKFDHNVLAISEGSIGLDDETVLRTAREQQRILITFDRDYGELIFKRQLPAPPGVLYLRFDPVTPTEPAEFLLTLLRAGEPKFENQFTVLSRNQIRQRPLPNKE
jgi:predicted nuclease of predicted toxin-antitoxin system